MKKRWNLLFVAMATLLLLSACGTTDTGKEKTPDEVDGSTGAIDDNDKSTIDDEEEEDKDTDPSTNEDDTPIEEDASKENRPETIVLSYNDGENDKSKEAELTKSDEQDYSIYKLPTYELTSEEPGRDILYFNDDVGSIFMRIETMNVEEGTYDYAVENSLAFLTASGGGETPEELTDKVLLPSADGIEKAIGYSVKSETGPVTGLVFEQEGIIVKLTIFDSPKSEHFDAFLRMAETISKN